jgi:hypothetical protein
LNYSLILILILFI